MANTQLLRRRIKTAQNVSKTTRAMQMIAASKLKKAQIAALSARPYVEKLMNLTKNLTQNMDQKSLPSYMQEKKTSGTLREARKTLLIVIAPDKGLCGALITNLAKSVLKRETKNDIYVTIGKKIEYTVVYVGQELIASFPFGTTLPSFDVVYPLAKVIDDLFLTGKVDRVEILSTHFESIFRQKAHVTKLLPIIPEEETDEKLITRFQEFEPTLPEILPDLLTRYIEMVLYQEILESYLSEQAARMLSMQNATNNAKDIIEDLKLEYNKTRQEKITSELLDITGGLVV